MCHQEDPNSYLERLERFGSGYPRFRRFADGAQSALFRSFKRGLPPAARWWRPPAVPLVWPAHLGRPSRPR